MKQFFRFLKRLSLVLVLLVILTIAFFYAKWKWISNRNFAQLEERALILTKDGHSYRDLNKNGQLDTYEDKRADIDLRIEDLLTQMNLEEKAGLLFINMAGMNEDGYHNEIPIFSEPLTFFLESNSTQVVRKHMNHFNIFQSPSAEALATWNNNMQVMAECTRLGIPVTVASDPRHSMSDNPGAHLATPFFSQWVSPLGFAAIGDTILMREFGEVARREYRTVGIRLALSPMADLATEPRWGRVNGTFGEDAHLSAKLTKAYILGFQGDSLNQESVACMTKHFAGGGPQKDGEDAHFPYGADQVYPGNNFDYHLIPFTEGAFPANTAQIMPYYGVPVGQTSEDVGFGYNKEIITGLLRGKYGFEGVICTDWGLVTDSKAKPAAAHGVENLTEKQRVAKIFEAGCDMLGGESCPELVVALVNEGTLSMERLDESVRRVLRDKFRLGLFDNPFVRMGDLWMVGHEDIQKQGRIAQQRSLVLLKNEAKTLPLRNQPKVYLSNFEASAVSQFATVVSSPEQADFIIQKLYTPFDERNQYLLEQFFHQGRLYFTPEELAPILELTATKPTITVMNLDRPAIITEIAAASQAIIADFDSSDEVIAELIFGEFKPEGKLPFELPSSREAVVQQLEDVPYDSTNPLFPFGHGLGYE
jgi:beta-glucosidase